MKTLVKSAGCAAACAVAMTCLAEATSVAISGNGYRQFVSGETAYSVSTTTKLTAEPSWVAESLLFAFDCSQTNGWTIASDGSVTKVPSRVGARYLTAGNKDELVEDGHYYGVYGVYYGSDVSSKVTPATLARDEELGAACLDFGASGSVKGLFFDPITEAWTKTYSGTTYSGERQNVLRNIGSIVGVYKSIDGGGSLLAGANYRRFVAYGKDSEGRSQNGVGFRFPIFFYNVNNVLRSGAIWTDLTRNAPNQAKWSGLWQVVTANPSEASLTSYGVGMGNIDDTDQSSSSGGQKIAELLIFNRVLTDDETRELVRYLGHKWLGRECDGYNGRAAVEWLALGDDAAATNPTDTPQTVTLDVPADETLAIGRLNGGRGNGAGPTVEKTGAGALTVGEASDFGGSLAVRGGSLKAVAAKTVPTLDQLAPYMTLRLDPSDEGSLELDENGAVSSWTNTAAYAATSVETNQAVQTDATRRPTRVVDALGSGLAVLDFGRYGSDGKYLQFSPSRGYQTVVAVVDARMFGGGSVMNGMFVHYGVNSLGNTANWNDASLSRLLSTTGVYVSDYAKLGSQVPNDDGEVWVNGHRVDHATGNEAPAWQVVAWRVPSRGSGANDTWLLGASDATHAGGLRLGEVLAWSGALPDEEIRDAVAYLMKKWLGRVPAGYADDSDVPAVQNLVVGGETAAVDVPEGETLTVGTLATDGAAVKTGAGTLAVVSGASLAKGLELRGGTLAVADGPDVSSNCEVAAQPALRLDASDATSLAFVRVGDYGTTNFIWNWTDRSGRIAAIQSRETNYLTKKPFLNDSADALCNGLPVVDFGAFHGGWDNGGATSGYQDTEARTLGLSRTLTNIRAVYLVLGSQAGGGQPLGCSARSPIFSNIEGSPFAPFGKAQDFLRSGGTITLETPLFGQACANVRSGELWVNGVKQEAVSQWAPSGGYDLVELHTAGGCLANMLGNSYGDYIKGGFRLGEIIVFERPLTEREKTATRNYLLKKWFGKTDADLAALPEKVSASISGDLTYDDGSWLSFTVADGAVANPLSLAGKLTFRAGARVVVKGFEGEVRSGGKLTLGEVDSAEGLENAVIDFGNRAFSTATKPYLRLIGRRLCVCFGKPGMILIVR